ncbi:MAG: aldo/keto reductase [Candidatus Omnitrophica bacterium]|nr:aldo/keto reductase [Candidatus Omnitrophota bacterium]
MELRKISETTISVSAITLGTWAFGGGKWWGTQLDEDSCAVLIESVNRGIISIDTAPIYGKGRSEKIIGDFIRKKRLRDKIVLATKLGLSWKGSRVRHNLRKKRMLQELDESRQRLQTDFFDIYQVHWPDPETSVSETADVMSNFYKKGLIKAVGVSNYSVDQIKEFMKYSPLHVLQPPYNMFKREIEKEIIPFCIKNNIAIIGYIPLNSGILTGKFFFENVEIPDDLCRKYHQDVKEPFFSINKQCLKQLKNIADKYSKTLTQLVLNWTQSRKGMTSIIVGARKTYQIEENVEGIGWEIDEQDDQEIESLLKKREDKINCLKK